MGGVCGTQRRVRRDTPLSEMVELWSIIRKKGLERTEMINLCTKVWPKFGVDWPKGGSFEPGDIIKVNRIIEKRGLWRQKRYVLLWDEVSSNERFHAAKQMICQTKLRQVEEEDFDELMWMTQGS